MQRLQDGLIMAQLIVGILCLLGTVIGIRLAYPQFLVAQHHWKQIRREAPMSREQPHYQLRLWPLGIAVMLVCFGGIGIFLLVYHPKERTANTRPTPPVSSPQTSPQTQTVPTETKKPFAEKGQLVPKAVLPAKKHAPAKESSLPERNAEGIHGSDNTQVNDNRPIVGDGNTIVGADSNGNVRIPGGTAIGNGAHTDSSGVAIGSHAGEGNQQPTIVNSAPGGFAVSGGTLINPQVVNNKPLPPQIEVSESVALEAEVPSTSGRPPRQGSNMPGASVTITLQGVFYNPAFVADCSTPCVLVRAWDVEGNGERSISTEFTPISTKNRLHAGVVYRVSRMLAGAKVRLEFRSLSDEPLTVSNVRTYVP